MIFKRAFTPLLSALAISISSPYTGPVWAQKSDVPPDISNYVRHYNERISSPLPEMRMGVLKELTYFHQRDSRLYPPFFRQLLSDPSPKIRWEALARLDDHGITVSESNLPQSIEVPLVGLLDRTNSDSLAYFRTQATNTCPGGGWAIMALGLIGDKEAGNLAESLLESEDVFVRYSAAVALIHSGKIDLGKQVLRQITRATQDTSGFYRVAAAERLWRLGDKQYIETIFTVFKTRSAYADGPIDVLADLTGEYFVTEEEWSEWWAKEGKAKYADARQLNTPTQALKSHP